jgi:branched-chain amino acid transport system substrate-binding protein
MNGNRRGRLLRAAVALLGAGTLVSLTACGSGTNAGSSSGGTGSLPAEMKVVSINPLTGPAAFAGLAANKGYEVAIEEINSTKYLGDNNKLVMTKEDTAGNAQTAASKLTPAVSDKNVAAVFGSVSSNEAVALAPIADKSKLPILFTQAGSPGVVIGDYTFRATPPMSSYYPKVADFIKTKNPKSVGIVYAAWSPTLKEIAEQTLPQMGKDLGFDVVSSIGTQQTTQDFSAPISQVLNAKPDMVSLLLVGASNPTAMKQLRQAGYSGAVLGNSGASAGNLKPAGADGSGMLWPVDYTALNKTEPSEKFVKLYQQKFAGETPLNYAAEAYDAAWWLARAIKEGKSADRSAVQKSMVSVANAGFTGAMGDLKFENGHDLRLPGVVVHWDGGKEVLGNPST